MHENGVLCLEEQSIPFEKHSCQGFLIGDPTATMIANDRIRELTSRVRI